MFISFSGRKTIMDIALSVLWFLTAVVYVFGWYVHGRTYKFFKTRWLGYDDGDLAFAAKLQDKGLPVITYNMLEYFTSMNLEHESIRQHYKESSTPKTEKKNKPTKSDQAKSVHG
uniref:Uncharacterized protein n=1 Tax=Setaria digitata TaxID=48799 RepID=A0A915PCA0_9BILA